MIRILYFIALWTPKAMPGVDTTLYATALELYSGWKTSTLIRISQNLEENFTQLTSVGAFTSLTQLQILNISAAIIQNFF
jgi:hypothetical protein